MNDILKDYLTLLAEQEKARASLREAELNLLLFLRLHETPKEPNERLYMEGKYRPVCRVCKQTIPKGTPVYWNPDRSTPDRCRHPFCEPRKSSKPLTLVGEVEAALRPGVDAIYASLTATSEN